MAKAQQQIQRFDLSQGFLTEFTELTLPENATVDESNATIELDGSRKRRKGLDYEQDYTLHVSPTDPFQNGYAVSIHDWRNVGGDANVNFVVVQTGGTLVFYDKNASSFSDNIINQSVNLLSHKVTGKTDLQVKQSKVEAAYGRTRLFVVGEHLEPFYIDWDGTNFSTTQITITERDFEGVDDSLGISTRPANLTSEHAYNLFNQGWKLSNINAVKDDKGVYPSNADISHFGKYINSSGKDVFDADQLTKQDFGNTPAPKGHYIRDAFDTEQSFAFDARFYIDNLSTDGTTTTITTEQSHGFTTGDNITIENTEFTHDVSGTASRSTVTYDGDTFSITVVNATTFTFSDDLGAGFDGGVQIVTLGYAYDSSESQTNPSGVTTDARPVSVAFFAGRAWWSGIADERLGNRVYFTQILEFDEQIGNCYQQADPTSEHINDLIDTDGGYLTISEMGQVLKMSVVGKNLLLFADNGVWNIGPGSEGYFTASSYSVRKISDMAITSPQAILMAEGVPVVWTYQGIYGMTEDQISGFMQPQSMSMETIQTFYKNIPDVCKEQAAAVYDDVSKKFYWSYSSDTDNPDKHDKILLFDARRSAFHKYDIGSLSNGPYVAGMSTVLGYDNEENKVKLFTIRESDGSYTFSTFSEDTFHDWKTQNGTGVDAEAFLVSAYEAGSDIARDKQTPTITFLFKRTETGVDASGALINPGSCYLQARWDWSGSDSSGKWNPERQIYRLRRTHTPASLPAADYDDGHPVVWSRNKVRGRGRALNFRLRSEENHDLHLLGWQIQMTGVTET